MTKNPLRDVLSRLLHDSSLVKDDYEIVYVSRGALDDLEHISGADLVRVTRFGFSWRTPTGVIKEIPFHRVVLVRNVRTGSVLYLNPRALGSSSRT